MQGAVLPVWCLRLHEALAAAVAVARPGGATAQITDYEMDVRLPAQAAPMLTFVASSRTG